MFPVAGAVQGSQFWGVYRFAYSVFYKDFEEYIQREKKKSV